MISKIAGILDEVELERVTVDVNGVGYELLVPMSTYDRLPRQGERVVLQVLMDVREDAITLFGFATKSEKQLFETVRSVSGIGPKTALSVLSCMPVESFCAAILTGDTKSLGKIGGVGKKTAERMILELRDKVEAVSPDAAFKKSALPDAVGTSVEEASLALIQLGFKPETVRKAVHKLASELEPDECNSENLIRKALQFLNS